MNIETNQKTFSQSVFSKNNLVFLVFIFLSLLFDYQAFSAYKKQKDLQDHGVQTIAQITDKFSQYVSQRHSHTTYYYLKYRFADGNHNIYNSENKVDYSIYTTIQPGTNRYVRYSSVNPGNSLLDIGKTDDPTTQGLGGIGILLFGIGGIAYNYFKKN